MGLRNALRDNYEELQEIIPIEDLPFTEYAYERLEAFGDLSCTNHLINYINMCNKNPQSIFALWTKNYGFLLSVFKNHHKPKNMIIVLSSPTINKEIDKDILDKVEKVVHVDVLFTVYDRFGYKDIPKENQCGLKCIEYLKCYQHHEETLRIYEKLK